MNCNTCNQIQSERLFYNNVILCKECFNAKQTLKHLHDEIEEGDPLPECETCGECKYGVTTTSWGCYSAPLCDYHYTTESHDANDQGVEDYDAEGNRIPTKLGDCELCDKAFDSGDYCNKVHNHCMDDENDDEKIVCCRCWCKANDMDCPDAPGYNEEEIKNQVIEECECGSTENLKKVCVGGSYEGNAYETWCQKCINEAEEELKQEE